MVSISISREAERAGVRVQYSVHVRVRFGAIAYAIVYPTAAVLINEEEIPVVGEKINMTIVGGKSASHLFAHLLTPPNVLTAKLEVKGRLHVELQQTDQIISLAVRVLEDTPPTVLPEPVTVPGTLLLKNTTHVKVSAYYVDSIYSFRGQLFTNHMKDAHGLPVQNLAVLVSPLRTPKAQASLYIRYGAPHKSPVVISIPFTEPFDALYSRQPYSLYVLPPGMAKGSVECVHEKEGALKYDPDKNAVIAYCPEKKEVKL